MRVGAQVAEIERKDGVIGFCRWSVVLVLGVEVDAGGDQHDQDRCGDPVDHQAQRRPPARVGNKVAALLPQVLDPMAGEAEHQQPRRSGDARRGDHHKDGGDPGRSSVGDGEAVGDGRDQVSESV